MTNIINETSDKMKQAIEHLKAEYKALRTNRVNPNLLDEIKVEVYGSQMPLKSVATISVQERNLIIAPFDPSTTHSIAKAISSSQLHLNGIVEQNSIRVPVPPLDETLRKDIAKQAKHKTEQAKVVVREIRRKGNELIKKEKSDGIFTEDDVKRTEKKIQELTDESCKELDRLFVEKEKEILTV